MKTNEKAAAGAIRNDSLNPVINLNGNQRLNAFDYSGKTVEKQLISSGAVEKLADDLTAHLVQQPRKVVKCVRCAGCQKPYAPSKMSQLYPICRNCLTNVRGKGAKAQSNFINRTINNFQIFLKGAITV